MRVSYFRAVVWLSLTAACALVLQRNSTAQQTVPFENGNPIAPAGFEPHAIPAEPIEYDTAEVMRIRVVPVARGLVNPWSLAFLPTGEMLVTEKEGRLRIIRNGVLDPKPIPGAPAVRVQGRSGLMDVVLHPQFGTNRFVYFSRALRRIRHLRAHGHLQLRSGRERAFASHLGARRQALYDDAKRRERQQLTRSEHLLGQGAAPE